MPDEPMIVVRQYIRNADDAIAAIAAIVKQVDAATLAALKKSQTVAKASVKSQMRGGPRWNHRGPINVGGLSDPAVTMDQYPAHSSRSGGPGKLTGHLSAAVGVVRRPKKLGVASYQGGIGAGGRRSVTQVYRKEVEARAPYMQPGVRKAEPKMSAAYEAAWAKATET